MSCITHIKSLVFDWIDGAVQHVYDVQITGESRRRAKELMSMVQEDMKYHIPDCMEDEPEGKYLWSGEWIGWKDYWGEYDEEWHCISLRKLADYTREQLIVMYDACPDCGGVEEHKYESCPQIKQETN